MTAAMTEVSRLLQEDFEEVVDAWFATQKREGVRRPDLFSDRESRRQLSDLLRAFADTLGRIDLSQSVDVDAEEWSDLRLALSEITLVRAERGVAPWEMTTFVLALKQPVFGKLNERLRDA